MCLFALIVVFIPDHNLMVLPMFLYHPVIIINQILRSPILFLVFCFQVIHHTDHKLFGSLLHIYLRGLHLSLMKGKYFVRTHS